MTAELTDELALAPEAARRLTELEATVERGLQTFVEVGEALREIRDSELYRAEHGTFEDYCSTRWGFTDRRARQLMRTAEIGTVVPVENERQARELAPLAGDEAELAETWRELKEEHGEHLTAEKVREAVHARLRTEQRTDRLNSSETCEWYTPPKVIEAAREVLGGIDLDPASCGFAQRTVRASAYFDADTDGLAQPWRGRVFLNPPYGALGPKFTAKALAEHEAGNLSAAILLLSGYSFDTNWFRPLWDCLLCFTDGRISFYNALGEPGCPSTATVFAYLGAEPDRFAKVFDQFGAVVERYVSGGAR